MNRTLIAVIALSSPGAALAAGGGGAFAELQYLPRYGPQTAEHEAPGWVGCIGGVGYGVTSRNVRIGGEGAWCGNRDDSVQMAYGGVQVGAWSRPGWLYWSFYSSFGVGALVDNNTLAFQEDPYTAIQLYAKPTLSMGLPLGFMALETGVFAQLPLNLVQFVGQGDPRGFVTPTVGLQVAGVFGHFKDPRTTREDRWREAQRSGSPASTPMLIDPPSPLSPPREQTIPEVPDGCDNGESGPDCPAPRDEGRPLAIPAQ